jgi:hypothetical protein
VSNHIITHTTVRIREGGLELFKQFQKELVEFVDANHARIIAFSAHINDEGTEAVGVQVHPDSESLELHMQLAASQISEANNYIEILHFEVLGDLSDSLRAKFEALDAPKSFWPLTAGFARSATA